jgi:hypothetical protein
MSPTLSLQDAELPVAGRHVGLIAEPLADVEAELIPAGGPVEVAAGLSQDAELLVALASRRA